MLLDRWFVCKEIFLSCDVVEGVGYDHGIFLPHLYLNYTETCFHETKTTKRITKRNETQCDIETFVYNVTSQM